mgnify:CR=1 FL=1
MSYRKVIVNGKEYKYVVGALNTKVVGVGVAFNSDIGLKYDEDQYAVRPSDVRDYILSVDKDNKVA